MTETPDILTVKLGSRRIHTSIIGPYTFRHNSNFSPAVSNPPIIIDLDKVTRQLEEEKTFANIRHGHEVHALLQQEFKRAVNFFDDEFRIPIANTYLSGNIDLKLKLRSHIESGTIKITPLQIKIRKEFFNNPDNQKLLINTARELSFLPGARFR